LVALLPVLLIVGSACSDDPIPQPCTGIPEHGCPLAHGVACEDPHCAAIYACRANNTWEFVQPCPSYDASAEETYDAGTPPVVVLDASPDAPPGAYGGPGCDTLQAPDCTVGFAMACTSANCCDCQDLFVCTNGAWNEWGSCDPDGGIRHDPQE
jgi:hypothetical protein